MKIQNFIRIALCGLLSFALMSGASAQENPDDDSSILKICDQPTGFVPIPSDSNCDPLYLSASLEDCAQAYVLMSVFCVNLFENPNQLDTYTWPEQSANNDALPDIYLKYTASPGVELVEPLHYGWKYINVEDVEADVFEFQVKLYPDFLTNLAQSCSIGPDFINTLFEIELVTAKPFDPKGYIPYPIADFTDPGAIFECEIFYETFGDCSNIIIPETFEMTVCVDCAECPIEPAVGGETQGRLQQIEATENIVINNNPFQNEISFDFASDKETSLEIEVFSSNGQLLLYDKKEILAGLNVVRIDASNITSGVYHLRVKHQDRIESFNLVKAKY